VKEVYNLYHHLPFIGVKGRIQSEVLEKEDGTKKYYMNVIAERVTFLSSKRQEEAE